MCYYLLVMAYHMELCTHASIVRIRVDEISAVISFLLLMPLKPVEKAITFVHAGLPVELYVIVSVVQMFYFHISGHGIIPLLLALFSLCLCWSFNCEFFQCFTA